ncbi:hypothetical protein ACJJIF_00030 (plasmid) [Microbulbifer sp. SSSA002]|uniref:hypothetical protein n=1 Tax=Microbulbifer sp. SSSA002 TaxID=3243376 RepID=UPI004039DF86
MNVSVPPISLHDKYTAETGNVYLTGIQALVRLALDRGRLDRANGLKTGGFISGYRGSPIAGYDTELQRSRQYLDPLDIQFQPGVNEELGATAVWGSQKVRQHGKGSAYDGVYGIWYGKHQVLIEPEMCCIRQVLLEPTQMAVLWRLLAMIIWQNLPFCRHKASFSSNTQKSLFSTLQIFRKCWISVCTGLRFRVTPVCGVH